MSGLTRAKKKALKLVAKQIPGHRLRAHALRSAGYRVGEDAYVGEDLIIIDELDDHGRVTIGDRVAIAPRVTLVVASNPNASRIREYAPVDEGPIVIEQDAWIGTGVIIMPNVTIGEGAIVGAGAVVTETVAAHTIVTGQPARPLRRIGVGRGA